MGPPNEVGPRDTTPEGTDTIVTSHREETGSLNRSGSPRPCAGDAWRPELGAGRRRDSRRLPPIGICGCIRDPDHDRHGCGGEITDRQLQGAVDAAPHILDAGYLPIFDLPTLRELWKSGHHQLVDELRGGDL